MIGVSLLALLFMLYISINAPTEAEMKEKQRLQDSIELASKAVDKTALPKGDTSGQQPVSPAPLNDSLRQAAFGQFANAGAGSESTYTLENDFVKITFTNKGGRIKEAQLKQYKKATLGEDHKEVFSPLLLLEDKKDKFEYLLPVQGGTVSSGSLYFKAEQPDAQTLVFRADAGEGRYFEQKYTLDDAYQIDYDISFVGMDAPAELTLDWVNHMDRLEINTSYERNYSAVYYKEGDSFPDHCSCTADDDESVKGQPIKWVSNANQFFNSSLIAKGAGFQSANLKTEIMPDESEDLKKISSTLVLPLEKGTFAMQMYLGPNEFERLRAFGVQLEDIIPFGSSIFGTINRWVIRPIFDFLSSFIGTKGLVILLLTFLVKLALYPLTFKMLHSQAKMGALKPEIEKMKERIKDPQQQQMESMKLYRETGVNPLGGCLPMVLQMPIWFALYRFFPASIQFRQESFLWANDLSSYDAIWLPFKLPLIGDHFSLFAVLWAISLLVYTYYNSRYMDFSAQPAMKYVQYAMPVIFLFVFNSLASGLTCYMLFSNLLNIFQTLATKQFVFNDEKIREELEANKKKPKKKGGFQERLEQAMKEQQRAAQERNKK